MANSTKRIKFLYASTIADAQAQIDARIAAAPGAAVMDVQVTGVNSGIQGQIQIMVSEDTGAGAPVTAAKLFGGTDPVAIQTAVAAYIAGLAGAALDVTVNGVSNGISGAILVTVLS